MSPFYLYNFHWELSAMGDFVCDIPGADVLGKWTGQDDSLVLIVKIKNLLKVVKAQNTHQRMGADSSKHTV